MTSAALLLLADSRLPAGGHAHSGGVEAAVAAGLVTGPADLAAFLRGRLATAGRQGAAAAACSCALAGDPDRAGSAAAWERLDAEVSARMPAPAQRAASRAQGRALLRVASRTWPGPALALLGTRPHHAVALGVATAAAGGEPAEAALLAATGSVAGPASAALRLLGLDPLAVTGLLAGLAAEIDAVAGCGSRPVPADPADLPAPGAPMLDLLAQAHAAAEVRLFAS